MNKGETGYRVLVGVCSICGAGGLVTYSSALPGNMCPGCVAIMTKLSLDQLRQAFYNRYMEQEVKV